MQRQTNRRRRAAPTSPPSQETGEAGDLALEIAALRDLLRQAGQLSEVELAPAARLRLLDIYSRAAGRLASLLKMQRALIESQGAGEAFSGILQEVMADIAKNKERFPEP